MSDAAPAKRGIPTIVVVVAIVLLIVVVLASCGSILLALAARRLDFGPEPNSDSSTWDPSDVPDDFRDVVGLPMPGGTTNCHYILTSGIDAFGVLRCDLPAREFELLMGRLRLTPWSAERVFADDSTWLDFDGAPVMPAPAWWAPPRTIDEHVYVSQVGSVWRFARHDGTTFWFKVVSH